MIVKPIEALYGTDHLSRCRQGSGAEILQHRLLQRVSRTFALTIPQLPARLAVVVGNAYLLCRIVDTIEDEPALDLAAKQHFYELFVAVLQGRDSAEGFACALMPLFSRHTPEAERELIRCTPQVIAMTHSFSARQQAAMRDCVQAMAQGMVEFQARSSLAGLDDMRELDRYCYYVAGVVGEMLTRLFCEYSPTIAAQREVLLRRAVSFGQGLQMTNILKDIWDDRARGVCWLPRDVFATLGFKLDELQTDRFDKRFGQGLACLIGVARGHLENALEYTLAIPPEETGIRHFCLWSLGLAVLTLRRLDRRRAFRTGAEVKVSRRGVRLTVLGSRLLVRRDRLLRLAFRYGVAGLPAAPAKR